MKILCRIFVAILAGGSIAPASRLGAAPSRVPSKPAPICYINKEYRFRITLPPTWNGYTVLVNQHEAQEITDSPGLASVPKERFTVVTIRHPRWTEVHPHEDLPVMVFTRAQWKSISNDELAVSAAPFPPSELSSNARYIFALPARYNYDYSSGWRELERILRTHPVKGF